MRRKFVIGLSILAACAAAGGAYAASNDTSPKQAFLNDVANRLHVTPQQLHSAFQGAMQDQLNAAVKAGRLTQAQANAIEKRLKEGGGPPLPLFRGRLLEHAMLFGGPLGAAAKYIGVAPSQLFNQLGSGKSLAQIARAHGKTVSGLENAIVTAERARLDNAHQEGLITSAQEQRLLSNLQTRIDALVNRAGIAPRFHRLMAPRGFFPPRELPGLVPPAGLVPAPGGPGPGGPPAGGPPPGGPPGLS